MQKEGAQMFNLTKAEERKSEIFLGIGLVIILATSHLGDLYLNLIG